MRNFTFRNIANIDINIWLKKINLISNEEWDHYDYRQKTFRSHVETKSIPIIWNQNFSEPPIKYFYYDLFEKELNKIKQIFLSEYLNGTIERCLLVKLLAKKQIYTHVDNAKSFENCHRHHMALVTSDDVIFKIMEDSKSLKPGELWEINNLAPHSVINNSEIDRIHLIIDWKTY